VQLFGLFIESKTCNYLFVFKLEIMNNFKLGYIYGYFNLVCSGRNGMNFIKGWFAGAGITAPRSFKNLIKYLF